LEHEIENVKFNFNLDDEDANKIYNIVKTVVELYPIVCVDTYLENLVAGCTLLYFEYFKHITTSNQKHINKFVEINRLVLKTIMKRLIAKCIAVIFNTKCCEIISYNLEFTINNYKDPNNISIKNKYEKYYDLENVTNISDWNLFTFETEWTSLREKIGIKIINQKKNCKITFLKKLNTIGPKLLSNEIVNLILGN
jgi:hypothetical protein